MQTQIELKELKHSPNNVRKVKPSDSGFKALCASIQSCGLLHNLVVTPNGKGYVVIDGNRRLDALKTIYKGKGGTPINCIVIDEDSAEVGLHANMIREDMHPLDECDVIMALCNDGQEDFDSVASRFGQTKRWVEQRISLSELSDNAKAMFRNGDFSMGAAQALTLGTKEKQDEFLADNTHFHPETVRRAMLSAKIPLTAALFDVKKHRSSLGIEADLFGDEEFITNREAFDQLQEEHIFNVCQDYRQQGYYDVVYAKDQYHWDMPELKGCLTVYNEEDYDISEMIIVVTYNTMRYALDTHLMVLKDIKEDTEAKKEMEEAEEEITPLTFSNPQKDLVYSYFADATLREMWSTNKIDKVRFFKALLCHRKLGYTYHHVNRIGHVYADPQRIFPSEGEPNGYTDLPDEAVIGKHIDACEHAYENNNTTPLMYCYSLPTKELDELFVACCLRGLSIYDFRSESMQTFNEKINLQNWFKPDATWVNKWKVNQLDQMEEWLFGNAKSGTKSSRVEKITEALSEGRFDPFGTWPPSEQSE